LSAHTSEDDVAAARNESLALDSGFAWFVAIRDTGHEHGGDSGLTAGTGLAIGAASGEVIGFRSAEISRGATPWQRNGLRAYAELFLMWNT